jgi:hypothetical protein
MKTFIWMLVLLAGFGLMFYSYRNSKGAAEPLSWADAFMYVGKAEPEETDDAVPYSEARLRLLPLSEFMRGFVQGFEKTSKPAVRRTILLLRESIIMDAAFRKNFPPEALAEGRLPQAGSDEVLAGASVARKDVVSVGGRNLRVVGVLCPEMANFARIYVLPQAPEAAGLFAPGDEEVRNAYIVRLPRNEAVKVETRKRLQAQFPPDRFTPIVGEMRMEARPYFLYLLGLALMLLGGSVLFVRLYAYLAEVVPWAVLRDPLTALRDWRRLLYGLHALFFGLFLLTAAGVYYLPSVQTILLSALRNEIHGGSGPLGVAGSAYGTNNIPLAAAVTLAVNFFVGTILSITLPSMVMPAIGSLAMLLRSLVIGAVLAPSTVPMAGMMLPHSFTLLVEMEAYIVATLFVLLIPIYLFRRSEGPTWYRRYGRALLVNLKGLLLIFGILAIVAVYEAIEVILQGR